MFVDNELLRSEQTPIRCFVYADPGRMKSTFAASFPKPMLVLATDPAGKLAPYRRRGIATPTYPPNPEKGIYVPTEYVLSLKQEDKIAIQIEHYRDRTMFMPDIKSCWEELQDRMVDLYTEDDQRKWATIVLDSMSSLEYAVRCHYQFKEMPVSKEGNEMDQRQWYRKSAEGIEQICYALSWMNANVVVLAHVRAERDAVRDTILWTPEAPGVRNRRIPSVFGEIYTVHVDNDPGLPDDVSPFFLQTRPDGKYVATTQIQAPDDCTPHYASIWANYQPQPMKDIYDVRATPA